MKRCANFISARKNTMPLPQKIMFGIPRLGTKNLDQIRFLQPQIPLSFQAAKMFIT